MTTKDETLKLALEHAKRDERHMNHAETRYWCRMYRDIAEKAVEALAEQPAQQEPVAVHQFRKRGCSDWYDGHPDHTDGGGLYEARTLYTSPLARHGWTTEQIAGMARLKEAQDKKLSQRTWVGLTDEEIDKTHETKVWDARRSYARAIEAKLKAKNFA